MSSSARDQCWLMFPTRRISPLGMCQTVPSTERRRVVRSDTASTVPVASPRSTMSPTPNWSSIRMNAPERKSRTRDCEPKPIATPSTPAPASSGPRSIPTSPRHISAATSQITKVTTLRRTLESASMRCSARTLVSPVSSRAAGVRRRIAPIRSRTAPVCRRVSDRFTARRARRSRIMAASTMRAIFSGGPSSQSVRSVMVFASSIRSTLATPVEASGWVLRARRSPRPVHVRLLRRVELHRAVDQP